MCEPISLGIASAATGVLGAVGQFQSAQAQTKAANESTRRNYKYQLKVRENEWMRATNDWDNRKINYSETVDDNYMAANEGYARAQRQLNEVFKSAAFAEQGDLVKLLESTGEMAASGQVGKSAQRVDNSIMAAFGRNNATRAASLASSKEGYQQTVEDIRREWIGANEEAFDTVAFAPTQGIAPPVPVLQKGPSPLSMLSGIGSAAVGGFQTYQSLQPPSVGNWSGFGTGAGGMNPALKINSGASAKSISPTGIDWNSTTNRLTR